MKVNVKIKKSVFNPCYVPLLEDQNRYLILYGGAGSGKSVFAGQKILYRLLCEEKHRFLVLRKVARTIRNSVFMLFKDTINAWGLQKLFKVVESNMEIRCANGNSIIFAGMDDPEKLKSITGITGIWVEEASEFDQADIQQLDLRLRGKTRNYKQMIISFNPISHLHWLKRVYFDSPKENATVKHTTYLDNKFIDEAYRQVLEDLKTQDYTYYMVYAIGQWGVLGNLIFTNYEVKEIPTDPEYYNARSNGLDFGFVHPSAFLKLAYKEDAIYIFDEVYESQLTNQQLIQLIKPKSGNEYTIADSAEPDRIAECRQSGMRVVPATKGKDSVKNSIDWLKRKKIYIHPRCINTIREIQIYKWREDAKGNVLDEPVNVKDDAMAALRYGSEHWRKQEMLTSQSGKPSAKVSGRITTADVDW
ncbi:PBSX family phage terminase large subunit [Aneurinibacillus sp. Ricciae_BoGa-3]|uniref:PBSX family phage terminase large subunit n=1 Tax=Aneurinibacillus sp. Ricciae_BoGa-3 TaxID=3022697 RepID=UPI002340A8ED|nr:PBSX family phage terminase large subunit [Aneurinibacillus sp. Ricciae_BoGa-3]WCK53848.1 PBSX family phage terminase large subunit [Aneurinibacillus sp. Ricciae_BoGa-3]